MGYKPTLKDLDELDQSSSAKFRPSARDFAEIDNTGWSIPDPSQTAIGKDLSSAGLGVLQLGADTVGGAVNLGLKGLASLFPNSLNIPTPQLPKAPFASMAPNKGIATGAELLSSLMVPFGQVNKLSQMYKGSQQLMKLGAKMGDSALTGAGISALYGASDPNKSALASAAAGGTLGAVLPLLAPSSLKILGAEGAAGGAEAYRKMLTRKADDSPYVFNTPEQAKKYSELLGDQKTNVAELANHAAGQKLYTDYLGAIPFTGVRDAEAKIVNNAAAHANDIVNKLKGDLSPAEMPKAIIKHVKDNHDAASAMTRELYERTWNKADEAGVKLSNRNNFKAAVEKELGDIEKGANKGLKKSDLNYIKSLSDKLTKATQLNPSYASPYKSYTPKIMDLREAHNIRSNLGDMAADAFKANDSTKSKIYTNLKKALDQDMQESISQSGNKDVIDHYRQANGFYQNELLPYKDNGIQNLIKNSKNQKLVYNEILNSKNLKVLNDLPQEVRNLVAYGKMAPATVKELDEVVASPARLNQEYQKLLKNDPAALNAVLTPQHHQDFEKLNALVNASRKAELAINKPPTGYNNTDVIVKALVGGALKGAAPLSIPLGNLLAKTLTSNELRNAFLNRKPVNPNALLEELIPQVMKRERTIQGKGQKATTTSLSPQYKNALYYLINNINGTQP